MDWKRPLQVLTPTLDGDVLAALARADSELTGRAAHRLIGHGSEQGIRKSLERLSQQGIVLSRDAGRARLYRLNRQHLAAPYVEGLAGLHGDLITRLRTAVDSWSIEPRAVLLFGSVARREAGRESDLDLLVVRPRRLEADDPDWCTQLDDLQSLVSAWTGNDTRVLELRDDELEEAGPVVDEVIAEGVEVAGPRRWFARNAKARA